MSAEKPNPGDAAPQVGYFIPVFSLSLPCGIAWEIEVYFWQFLPPFYPLTPLTYSACALRFFTLFISIFRQLQDIFELWWIFLFNSLYSKQNFEFGVLLSQGTPLYSCILEWKFWIFSFNSTGNPWGDDWENEGQSWRLQGKIRRVQLVKSHIYFHFHFYLKTTRSNKKSPAGQKPRSPHFCRQPMRKPWPKQQKFSKKAEIKFSKNEIKVSIILPIYM